MSLWSLSHQEAGCPGLPRTQNLPTRHPGRGVNSHAIKTVVNVTGSPQSIQTIFRVTGKVIRLGEDRCGHSDLLLNGQLSDGLTTEELIDTHLPIINEVQWPCHLLLVAPIRNQLWIVDVFLFVLGNHAYWLTNSVPWPDFLKTGSPILFLIVASGPSILVLLSKEYGAYNKKYYQEGIK